MQGGTVGEVPERHTAHLEPLGGRRHILLNSSVEASVPVMYKHAKGWGKQNDVRCWLGERGERALLKKSRGRWLRRCTQLER